jgi:hypothetical protein
MAKKAVDGKKNKSRAGKKKQESWFTYKSDIDKVLEKFHLNSGITSKGTSQNTGPHGRDLMRLATRSHDLLCSTFASISFFSSSKRNIFQLQCGAQLLAACRGLQLEVVLTYQTPGRSTPSPRAFPCCDHAS